MDSVKYVGLDVHQETTSAAVLDSEGRLVMQVTMATRASAILDFIGGLRGTLHSLLKKEHIRPGSTICCRGEWRAGGVQSAQERAAEVGQQGGRNRCTQAGRVCCVEGLLSPVYHGETSAVRGSATGAQLH